MATFYIAALNLEEILVDKDTGAPLAGGYIQFWEDANRTTPKPVFQQVSTGSNPGQPTYDYIELPNPVQLSGVGTPQDANGNNVTIYYYPFDTNGNLQLYYITVFNYLGVQQFTREGWPPLQAVESAAASASAPQNIILNPQFASVYFSSPAAPGLTHSYVGGGIDIVPIGPYWDLIINHTGAGTVTVTRTSVVGNLNYPTNPPYLLNVIAGANISVLQLRQRLINTPAILAASIAGTNGFVASYMLAGPGTNVNLQYAPSVGAPTTLLTANNTAGGSYAGFPATIELPISANTATADTGYVDIFVNMPINGTSSFSSIQVVGLDADVSGIDYVQTPVTRQLTELGINQIDVYTRPAPSYLTGWDFPMNPSQFNPATIIPVATGNNKSYYIRDQTILFQSISSGVSISNDVTGALKVTAALAGQHALVQYLPAPQAIEILSRKKCVNVSAYASTPTLATVSLWYTTAALPSTIASNNSLVLTLDAAGYPATQNGTWLPVPCNGTGAGLNGQRITIGTAPAVAAFNQYPLNGWGALPVSNATFFAIVIGTAPLAATSFINYQSISCQDGNSPTIPAPKTFAQNLQDCQQYWWSTFPYGVQPGTGKSYPGALGAIFSSAYSPSGGANTATTVEVHVSFPVQMEVTPIMIAYNPISNNSNWYNATTASDTATSSFDVSTSVNGFGIICTVIGVIGNIYSPQYIHVSADARLGQ